MSRIATIDLAEGALPEKSTVIIDIDVYTPAKFSVSDSVVAKRWIERAHIEEKKSFFKVLGKENTERLKQQ